MTPHAAIALLLLAAPAAMGATPGQRLLDSLREADAKISALANATTPEARLKAALEIRRDPFTVQRLNTSGRSNLVIDYQSAVGTATKGSLDDAQKALSSKFGLPPDDVRFYSATNVRQGGAPRASQDTDYTLQIRDRATGEWKPVTNRDQIREAERAVGDGFYRRATGAAPPTDDAAAAFARSHHVTHIDPRHTEYYAGGAKVFENQAAGRATLRGLATSEIEDLTHALRLKSNHAILEAQENLSRAKEIASRIAAENPAQAAQWVEIAERKLLKAEAESARQLVKQWDKIARPTLLHAGSGIPQQLDDQLRTLRDVADQKLSLAQAQDRLQQAGLKGTYDDLVDDVAARLQKAGARLNRAAAPVPTPVSGKGGLAVAGLAMLGEVMVLSDQADFLMKASEQAAWKGEKFGFAESGKAGLKYLEQSVKGLIELPATLGRATLDKAKGARDHAAATFERELVRDQHGAAVFVNTARALGTDAAAKIGTGAMTLAGAAADKATHPLRTLDQLGQAIKLDRLFGIFYQQSADDKIRAASRILPDAREKAEKRLDHLRLAADVAQAKLEALIEKRDQMEANEFVHQTDRLYSQYESAVSEMQKIAHKIAALHRGIEDILGQKIPDSLAKKMREAFQMPGHLPVPALEIARPSGVSAGSTPAPAPVAMRPRTARPAEPLHPLEADIDLPEKLYCKQRAIAIIRIRGGKGPYTLSGKGHTIQIGSADAPDAETKVPIQAPGEPGTFTFEAQARDATGAEPVIASATCPIENLPQGPFTLVVIGPDTARAGESVQLQVTIAGGTPPYHIFATRHGDADGNRGTEIARYDTERRISALACPFPNPGTVPVHVQVSDAAGGGPGLRIHTVQVQP